MLTLVDLMEWNQRNEGKYFSDKVCHWKQKEFKYHWYIFNTFLWIATYFDGFKYFLIFTYFKSLRQCMCYFVVSERSTFKSTLQHKDNTL